MLIMIAVMLAFEEDMIPAEVVTSIGFFPFINPGLFRTKSFSFIFRTETIISAF